MELLPPGFRFFPTDEELITCYLARKAMDASFTSPAIRDVDLYKSEPWDLPLFTGEQQAAAAAAAATGGGDLPQEGYFFCTRGSKYLSGVRARRATRRGYWKSTGKDKAVHGRDGRLVVGTRKTLVFYGGRAPRGVKTGWVMHEYAMGERSSSALLRGAQSEWVICKVFMRKHHATSDDRKLTAEETVNDQGTVPGTHLLPMAQDGCDSEQAPQPPVVTDSRHTVSNSGASVMDSGNEELLMMNRHVSSCPSPSRFNHDDNQLRAHCSVMPITRMESDDADYYLPELLEYSGCDDDLPDAALGLQDTGAEGSRRAEITPAAIAPLHLDYLYWNFGF